MSEEHEPNELAKRAIGVRYANLVDEDRASFRLGYELREIFPAASVVI